jgi:hypothetical protein
LALCLLDAKGDLVRLPALVPPSITEPASVGQAEA